MKVFWREHKTGQRLIFDSGTGQEEEVGGVRRTPRGFPTLEDAKAFVVSFHPWDIFVGTADVEFDEAVHPIPD